MSETYNTWGGKPVSTSVTTWGSNTSGTYTSTSQPAYVQRELEFEKPLAEDREELVAHLIEESVNVFQDAIDLDDSMAATNKVVQHIVTLLEELGLKYAKDKKKEKVTLTKVSKTPPKDKAKYYSDIAPNIQLYSDSERSKSYTKKKIK